MRELRRFVSLAAALLLCLALLPAAPAQAAAPDDWSVTNPDTGYRAVIVDELGLLTDSERSALLMDMLPVTEYGNLAFWSTDAYASNEIEQARLKRKELFGFESASIFAVNMNIRRVSIQSYGEMYDVITKSRANTITNNIRNYLTREDYYNGARIAFEQIGTLMHDGRIPQQMKYLSNACIALLIALMVLLRVVIRRASTLLRPEVVHIGGGEPVLSDIVSFRTGETRTYSPPSSDSGSSCSSCGGGGSSCGGCGGGGSSSF